MTNTNTGQSKRHRRKQQRPAEIVRAAQRLFARHGFASCRLDDIAAEAGISKGTIYLYFDSKLALFKAVVHELIEPAFEFSRTEDLIASNRASWGALLERILGHWAAKLSDPEIAPSLRLLVSDAQNVPELAAYCHEQIFLRGQQLVERVLANAVNACEFCALDESRVAQALASPFHLLTLWPSDPCNSCRERGELCAAVNSCIELLIRGLRITPTETEIVSATSL